MGVERLMFTDGVTSCSALELDQQKCHNQLSGASQLHCAHISRLKMQLYLNSLYNSIQGDISDLVKEKKWQPDHNTFVLHY